jgi:hypothetical protein
MRLRRHDIFKSTITTLDITNSLDPIVTITTITMASKQKRLHLLLQGGIATNTQRGLLICHLLNPNKKPKLSPSSNRVIIIIIIKSNHHLSLHFISLSLSF